jgi:hypothetical protein
MNYKDLVNHASDSYTKALRELNLQNTDIPSEKLNAILLGNLVTMISTLALCVASIADDINEIKKKRR